MKRIGVFRVSREMLETDGARMVMGCCVIVRVEHLYIQDVAEFTAISPLFDEVPIGLMPPFYRWILEKSGPLDQLTVRPEQCDQYDYSAASNFRAAVERINKGWP